MDQLNANVTSEAKKTSLEKALEEAGFIKVITPLHNAVLALLDVFSVDELVKIYDKLLGDYLRKYPEVIFGQTMVVDERKEINYQNGENKHTRSTGIRTKQSNAVMTVGKTKKKVEHKTTGDKRSNERDPKIEANYKARVAVHASTLREHANWSIGAYKVEEAVKESVMNYTKKYNETFGTSFNVHYAKPRKDWVSWYLSQSLKKENTEE